MSDHYEELGAVRQLEQIDVLREIRNEINTPELRDRIAMKVMQGGMDRRMFWATDVPKMIATARMAYEWADAMLEVRNKR